MNRDSGKKRGYRKTKGGRPDVRNVLYMSPLNGIQHNPVIQAQYDQLVKRGKEKKVANHGLYAQDAHHPQCHVCVTSSRFAIQLLLEPIHLTT